MPEEEQHEICNWPIRAIFFFYSHCMDLMLSLDNPTILSPQPHFEIQLIFLKEHQEQCMFIFSYQTISAF